MQCSVPYPRLLWLPLLLIWMFVEENVSLQTWEMVCCHTIGINIHRIHLSHKSSSCWTNCTLPDNVLRQQRSTSNLWDSQFSFRETLLSLYDICFSVGIMCWAGFSISAVITEFIEPSKNEREWFCQTLYPVVAHRWFCNIPGLHLPSWILLAHLAAARWAWTSGACLALMVLLSPPGSC